MVNAMEVTEQALAALTQLGVHAARRGEDSLELWSERLPGVRRGYHLEVRSRVTTGLATVVGAQLDRPTILVTAYVPEPAAEILRRRGIDYVDLAGNALLRWDGLLIDIRGRKPSKAPGATAPTGLRRPFTRSGAQVTFCLLAWPEVADRPVRELARASGTAVGGAHAVLRDLESGGYLTAGSSGRVLTRAGELLNRWTEAYALSLSASLHLGYYRAPDPGWWLPVRADLQGAGVQLGGEAAASELDSHLRPAGAVLYGEEIPARLLAKHRCQKAADAKDANVVVRRRFWTVPGGVNADVEAGLVPAVLVYADLLVSGEPRQREHAERLRRLNARLEYLDRS
jgi:hypothetical protein